MKYKNKVRAKTRFAEDCTQCSEGSYELPILFVNYEQIKKLVGCSSSRKCIAFCVWGPICESNYR